MLAAYGVEYLCSARFQLGLGPVEDGTVGLGGVAPIGRGGDMDVSRSSSSNSSSRNRAVDRTIFWNLVLHFREFCLPITFLLAEEATAGERRASLRAV